MTNIRQFQSAKYFSLQMIKRHTMNLYYH